MFHEVENTKPVPEDLLHVWDWFRHLSARRRYDQGAAQPLGWLEVEGFFRLHKEQPTVWEINLIMRLDALELNGAKE